MLNGILSITGQSGLFKLVSQAKNSIIIESLIDGHRMPAYPSSRVSSLEDISMYTEDGDIKLEEVFLKIFDFTNGAKAIDPKSNPDELKSYMEKILPNYDKQRVYVSDIKKLFTWYNLLVEKNMIKKMEEKE